MHPAPTDRRHLPLLALLLPLAACQGESTTGVGGSESIQLHGSVETATPVSGATVRLYTLDDDGKRGEELASAVTDDNGRWRVSFAERLDVRPLLVESEGGRYRELDSGVLAAAGRMQGMVVTGTDAAAVTPLSTIAAGRVQEDMAGGTVRESAVSSVSYEFLLRLGVNPLDTPPARAPWDKGSSGAFAHAAVLAAADRLVGDRLAYLLPAVDRFRLLEAVVADTGNGYIDGLDIHNDPVGVRATGLPGPLQFTGAANRFLAANGIDRIAISLNGLNQLVVAPQPRRDRDEPCDADAWFADRAGTYAMTVAADGTLADDLYAGTGPWELFVAADGTVTLETDAGTLALSFATGGTYDCPPAHDLRLVDGDYELQLAQLRNETQVLYVTLARRGEPQATYITARRY